MTTLQTSRWRPLASLGLTAFVLALFMFGTSDASRDRNDAPAQVSGAIVAPNLMIIMANGYSMNREMDDQNFPSLPSADEYPFVSVSNPAVDVGPSYNTARRSEQPTSKFFLAKRAITEIINDDSLSANVNIGLATWRTVFNQPFYVATGYWQFTGVEVFPNDFDIINQPTSNRFAYASDPKNFKAIRVDLGPATANPACPAQGTNSNTNLRDVWQGAIVGRGLCDGGKEVIKESSASYMTANGGVGGIPEHVVANHLGGFWDIWSNPIGVGYAQNNFPAPDNFEWMGSWMYSRTDKPPNAMHFCGTGYSSEGNWFGATYLNDYANPGGPYQYLHDFRDSAYDASNKKGFDGGTFTCSGTTVPDEDGSELLATQVRKPDGSLATVDGIAIMRFYTWAGSIGESIPNGALTGWSGENVLIDGAQPTETLTANYPSGPAATENPAVPGRQLLSRGLIKNGVQHMGPFLDLPAPAAGYVDQREIVRGFMLPTQMAASGLEYDPVTQRIAPDGTGRSTKGIRASDAGGEGQSPVYDSLFGALAYYSAYKKADVNDSCRSNHVLLLYDGKENSRYYYDATQPGGIRWADPAEMSKRLFDELGVSTHVIIISAIRGDIEEADRIAKNGGTTKAYVIGDYTQMQAALRNVFNDLQAKIYTSPPAVPVYVRGGEAAYASVNYASPSYGTIEARKVLATGEIEATPLWDTNALMSVANRTSSLYSSVGGVVTNFSSIPAASFAIPATSTLTPSIVTGYTIDPDYGGGIYLAGRRSGALQGKSSSAAAVTSDPVASPELVSEPGYVTYTRAFSAAAKLVLFSSSDGFLYAVGQENGVSPGTLRWGWMPNAFLDRLKNFATFHNTGAMDGEMRIIDVKTGTGTFERVVVATADKGRLHFALALNASGGLDRVLWEDSHPLNSSDPNSAPFISREASGTYAIYLRGTFLRKVNVLSGVSTSIDLSTLSPTGALTAGHFRAPYMFIGTAEGDLYQIDVVGAGTPVLVGALRSSVGGTVAENSITAVTSAVLDGQLYVVANSSHRMTVFSRPSTATGATAYARAWSVYNGGAEGSAENSIPLSGRFSAGVVIVEGIVFAPITVDGSSARDSCLKGTAEIHLFRLSDGDFPAQSVFDKATGAEITGRIVVGSGESLGMSLTQFENGMIGAYAAAQASGAGGAGSTPLMVRAPATRVVWWREVDRENY